MNPRQSTGLYHGLLTGKKVPAFLKQYEVGLICDPFLREAAKHINAQAATIAELEAKLAEATKTKRKKATDEDAS